MLLSHDHNCIRQLICRHFKFWFLPLINLNPEMKTNYPKMSYNDIRKRNEIKAFWCQKKWMKAH